MFPSNLNSFDLSKRKKKLPLTFQKEKKTYIFLDVKLNWI